MIGRSLDPACAGAADIGLAVLVEPVHEAVEFGDVEDGGLVLAGVDPTPALRGEAEALVRGEFLVGDLLVGEFVAEPR